MLEPDELARAEHLASELADFALGQLGGRRPGAHERSTKSGPADWVTVVDVDVERHVRERLAEAFPDHAVVGEELGERGPTDGSRPVWYVDPVDGTTNFVHGLPWSSFSLSLAVEGRLVLGVVADPYRNEVFTARAGHGARLNGRPLRCQEAVELTGGAVLTELNGTLPWPGLAAMLDELGARGCVTRVMGSSALSLASLGAGRAGGVVLGGFHPIDVSAGVLIAHEAGAEIAAGPAASRLFPLTRPLAKQLLVAAVPGLADQLCGLLEGLTA